MTYCVGILLNTGLVFAADTRTNAGVDHVSSFKKLSVFEQPGERVMVILSAGNLATTQAVVNHITRAVEAGNGENNILAAPNMFDAAEMVGAILSHEIELHGEQVKAANADASASFILGGQIKGGQLRLFQIYSAGNFIEASAESPFVQIGETKYGKPILDRVIDADTPIHLAVKAALLSFDSTMRSNLSVGLPIDVVTVKKDAYAADRQMRVDADDPFYQDLRKRYDRGIVDLFDTLPEPDWASD